MLLRCITLAVFVLTGAHSFSSNASTEQWFKKSAFTITESSELPGIVLEAGTYVLKAEEGSSSPRTVVQLFNQDETQLLATFMAVPDHRQRPDYNTVVAFFPSITDGSHPIQSWFHPGEMNGYEFVYPMHRAKEIAKDVDDHVMASATKEGSIVAVTRSGTEVPIYDPPGAAKAKLTEEPTRQKPSKPPRNKQP